MDETAQRMFQTSQSGLVERTLNVNDIFEMLRHALKGEVVQNVPETIILDGKPQLSKRLDWVKSATPFMNDEGVEALIAILQLNMNQVVMSSNLDEEKIEEIVYNIDISVIKTLINNSYKWRIDVSKLSVIIESIRQLLYSVAYRSREGWLLDALTKITTINEEILPPQPNQRLRRIPFVGGLFGRGGMA